MTGMKIIRATGTAAVVAIAIVVARLFAILCSPTTRNEKF